MKSLASFERNSRSLALLRHFYRTASSDSQTSKEQKQKSRLPTLKFIEEHFDSVSPENRTKEVFFQALGKPLTS